MSHIQVELKVIEVLVPHMARSTGIAEDRIGWGLNRLWHSCWSLRKDIVGRAELAGVFGPDRLDDLIAVLLAFELLAGAGDDTTPEIYRVKGADKYLRVLAGRSKGGKAASGNLKRGTKKGPAGDHAGGPAGKKPEPTRELAPGSTPADQRLLPGLSPNTEHRTPSTEKKISAAPPRATNPRHAPMVEKLGAVYFEVFGAKYDFGDKRDFAAIVELLKKTEDDDEIVARFAFALVKSKDKFHTPKTRTIAQLARDWNSYPVEKRTVDPVAPEVEKIREAMRQDAAANPGVWR